MTELELRNKYVNNAISYLNAVRNSTGHLEILKLYNSQNPLPRGVWMLPGYDWCAAFVTAMAVKTGITSIIACECSCNRQISDYKARGRWIENDAYVPNIGDIVYYDWEDSGYGDNQGESDHVGIVTAISGDRMTIIEGNTGNDSRVGYRTLIVNGRYIRGYGIPNYASLADAKIKKPIAEIAKEVIAGKWGVYPERKTKLESEGYNYQMVQKEVSKQLNTNVSKPVENPKPSAPVESNKVKYTKTLQQALNTSYRLGLAVDGSAGPATQSAINAHYLYYKNPVIVNSHVTWLQNALKKIGFSIEVDGSFGPATRAAVISFQSKYKLEVDGYAGKATHLKLLELV